MIEQWNECFEDLLNVTKDREVELAPLGKSSMILEKKKKKVDTYE